MTRALAIAGVLALALDRWLARRTREHLRSACHGLAQSINDALDRP